MPEIKDINYVLAVAECRSISKAAELLFISQPSLSRYISKIEEEIGISLFERKTNGIQLTDAGKIYVEYGKEIKRLNSTMEQKLKNLKLDASGDIRMWMALNASTLSTMEIQKKMKERYPECSFKYSNVMTKDIIGGLKSNSCNFAVGPQPEEIDGDTVYEILKEEYLVLAVPDIWNLEGIAEKRKELPYPWINLSKLPDINFILQDENCRVRKEIEEVLKESGKDIQPAFIVANSILAIQALDKQLGCCFISEAFFPYLQNKEKIRFYCVGDPIRKTKTGILYLKHKRFTDEEKYCIKLIRKMMQ